MNLNNEPNDAEAIQLMNSRLESQKRIAKQKRAKWREERARREKAEVKLGAVELELHIAGDKVVSLRREIVTLNARIGAALEQIKMMDEDEDEAKRE